ncbi:TolC family protein [Vibrio profundi]|uniref:TolC family protein n=1 Tax=Vibrio profundi TaxID=1774960 RepID=UPI0037369660
MMKVRLGLMLITIFPACGYAHAQLLTMSEFWQATKGHNPDYLSMKLDLPIAKLVTKNKLAPLLPSLQTSIDVDAGQLGSNNKAYGYSIQLSQTMWDQPAWTDYLMGKNNETVSKWEFEHGTQKLAMKSLVLYLGLALAQSRQQWALDKWEQGKKLYAYSEQRYLAGMLSNTDLNEVKVNTLSEELNYKKTRRDIVLLQKQLQMLTSLPMTKADVIPSFEHPPSLKRTREEWISQAYQYNPQLRAYQLQLESKRLASKSAYQNYYPTLKLTSGIKSPSGDEDLDLATGLVLSINFDTTGAIDRQYQIAKLQQRQMQLKVEGLEQELEKKVSNTVTQLQFTLNQIVVALEQSKIKASILKDKKVFYQAGHLKAEDMITAHNEWFSSRNEVISHFYAYWLKYIELMKTAGTLKEDEIAKISEIFHS